MHTVVETWIVGVEGTFADLWATTIAR